MMIDFICQSVGYRYPNLNVRPDLYLPASYRKQLKKVDENF